MNLDKVDASLAHAFQESEGPFQVVATFVDGSVLAARLTKAAIETLTENPGVSSVKIATRTRNRRKGGRPGEKDRRWD